MSKQYVATSKIFVDTVLAHNVGDTVPEENVKANGWEDSVSREGTKAAEQAQTPAPAPPASEPGSPAQ